MQLNSMWKLLTWLSRSCDKQGQQVKLIYFTFCQILFLYFWKTNWWLLLRCSIVHHISFYSLIWPAIMFSPVVCIPMHGVNFGQVAFEGLPGLELDPRGRGHPRSGRGHVCVIDCFASCLEGEQIFNISISLLIV